ncbi:MAG: marine proteobacterial sortase target protein [Gammaproteobacteria bacterium]
MLASTAQGSPLEWVDGDARRPAPHLSTAVEIEVSGLIARVGLTQRFRNDGSEWTEGVYTFPLPAEAAVDTLRMRYGTTVVVGEVQEKQLAERRYREGRDAGHRSVLVDRQRPNLFTTRVANVGPGETVEIEIGWQQAVGYEDGEYALRLPLTITPRYFPRSDVDRPDVGAVGLPDSGSIEAAAVSGSDGHRLTLSGIIDAGVELESVTGRYHPLRVTPDGGVYRIALAGTDVAMDRDVEIGWRPLAGTGPSASLFRGTGTPGDQTVLLFFQPPHAGDRPGAWRPPREVIFVIDTSGSMHGESLAQARRALALALGRLRPEDRFNIVQFNTGIRWFFPSPVPGTAARIGEALALTRALKANGGTEMEPALRAALRPAGGDRLRQVVFITDGAVGNETELLALIRAELGETRLFTVAIGSAPNRWFMHAAAEAGRGSALVIGSVGEVAEQMDRLFRRLERPALTDLAVTWPPGVQAESYPSPVPDLYHGEPVMVTARLDAPLPPDAVVTVSGRLGDGYWTRQLTFGDARTYAGIGKLWARGRIAALEGASRAGADPEEMRRRILETALAYQLVSRHTSLVAVDASPARPAQEGLDSRRVPGLVPRGQKVELVSGWPATGTSAPLRRLAGLLGLLGGLLLLLALRWQDIRRYRAA